MRCATPNCWPTRSPPAAGRPLRDYAATRDALSLPLFEVDRGDRRASTGISTGSRRCIKALNQAMKQEVEHLLTLGMSIRRTAANPVMIEEEVL